jgi:lipopolysaccharide export LptBFGC system permease protein LptF
MSSPAATAAGPGPDAPAATAPRRHRFSLGIQLYLGREVLKSSLLVFAGFQVIIGCIFAIGAVRDFGLDLGLIIPLMVPALAANMNAAIPISLLFGTTMVFGRFIADREMMAFKSFGFSYLELAFLPAALGAAVAVVTLILNLYLFPTLRFTRDNLGAIILERLRYLGEGRDRTLPLKDGYILWIEHYRGSSLTSIWIGAEKASFMGVGGAPGEGGPQKIQTRAYPVFLYAERGEVVSAVAEGAAPHIQLLNVSAYIHRSYFDRENTADYMDRWDLDEIKLQVQPDESKLNNRERTYSALRRQIRRTWSRYEAARARNDEPDTRAALDEYYQAVTELNRRFTFALAVLLFPLAGACVALFLNSPNRLLPVFVSLMLVPAIFYVLEMRGNSLARAGHLPWLWEELGNLGLGVLATSLFWILRRRTLW